MHMRRIKLNFWHKSGEFQNGSFGGTDGGNCARAVCLTAVDLLTAVITVEPAITYFLLRRHTNEATE